MRRFRFNIASLLVVVLIVAVGFAALRESNDLWDSGLFTLTLAILLVSIFFAVHRTESRRAFWLGFAGSTWGCYWSRLSNPG
jgi:type IV secretory pathway VirB2 component (pilin)